MKKLLVLFLSLLLGGSFAFAKSENNFYGGLQLGTGTIEMTNNTYGFSYGIFGGYNFAINNRFSLAPEIGFTKYPDYNSSTSDALGTYSNKITGESFNLLITAQYYVAPQFNLIGKAGAAYVREIETNNFIQTTGYQDYHKILAMFSLGLGYDITPILNVNVTYNTTMGGSHDILNGPNSYTLETDPVDVSSFMAGITYTFQ